MEGADGDSDFELSTGTADDGEMKYEADGVEVTAGVEPG